MFHLGHECCPSLSTSAMSAFLPPNPPTASPTSSGIVFANHASHAALYWSSSVWSERSAIASVPDRGIVDTTGRRTHAARSRLSASNPMYLVYLS